MYRLEPTCHCVWQTHMLENTHTVDRPVYNELAALYSNLFWMTTARGAMYLRAHRDAWQQVDDILQPPSFELVAADDLIVLHSAS